jgi:hypothetical protein
MQGEGIWPSENEHLTSCFFEFFSETVFQWPRLPTLILTLTLTPIYQLNPNPGGGQSPPEIATVIPVAVE